MDRINRLAREIGIMVVLAAPRSRVDKTRMSFKTFLLPGIARMAARRHGLPMQGPGARRGVAGA
jgi:hypothetical protein